MIKRMWINQPSTLQKFHKLHGTNVLAKRESIFTYTVYFLSGEIHCQQMSHLVLSRGWV